ncbi:MAG: hypothetical protein LBH28_09990 [Oscillospiraceae bacterium]|jgi:hypothetical protein|nr:hypothetical protein [Oscillospiraceae bacterium]
MNKKVLITIIVVIVVIAAAVGAYLIFSGSDYSLYSKAFTKTFDTDSMELNMTVKAEVSGGDKISSTANYKLKGMKSNTTQFINVMDIGDHTITQFSDGQFVYTDDGQNKNKVKLGDQPAEKQQDNKSGSGDFSFETYITEFSGLLDASKFKDLNAIEAVAEKYVDKIETATVSGGKQFIVTLLPQAVDDLVDTFLTDNLSNSNSNTPSVKINKVTYTATVSSDYVTEIVFKIDADVTAPGESSAKKVVVDFVIKPANPGKAVSFSLPSTDGF